MPLLTNAEPLNLPGGSPAVLVLHGFTGQPHSVKTWAQFLHDEAGLAVSVPRLPGHGTTWQEMNKTVWQDWYAEVLRALRQLRQDHRTVFVMGLSMGGALALRLAEEHGDEIAGLVLVNPAVFTTRPDRFLLPVLRRVMGGYPGITNDIKKPGVDEMGYNRIPLNAAHSLQQMWGIVRESISEVKVPLLIYTSAEDHTVEPENSEWILEHVSSVDRHQEILRDSYHVATLDNEAKDIFTGSLDFVRKYS